MAITDQERKERLLGIGGTDIGVILGLSPYKTPYQLFLEKTGIIEDTQEENKFQYWGTKLEPLIRDEFALRNNVKIETPETQIHPFYDFMRANVDGFITEWNSVLEVKSSSGYSASQWGETGTNMIPVFYLTQVAHYVATLNADSAHIAVLIGGNDYREFKYIRDSALEDIIIDAAKKFWECVKTNVAPPAISQVDLKLMYPTSQTKPVAVNDEALASFKKLNEIKKQIKELNNSLEKSKIEIMDYMKDADSLTTADGETLVSWKSNKRGSRVFLMKGDENV
jgi:putative phage-type endonuclease